jgi:hypothetical protein
MDELRDLLASLAEQVGNRRTIRSAGSRSTIRRRSSAAAATTLGRAPNAPWLR